MMTNTQSLTKDTRAKSGFTLIEVIAVLVLLGILTAIALPRYIDMADNARERAIDAAVSELNGRESLAWGQVMTNDGGYTNDGDVFGLVDATNLGNGYSWTAAPDETGGTIEFESASDTLTRTASTATQPGVWARP